MRNWRRVYGSCASKDGNAVLILGPSGSGKSDLVLRLVSRGFDLVADDQVDLRNGLASAPPELAGLLEVRGLGIVQLDAVTKPVPLRLVVVLGAEVDRLPYPARHPDFDLPAFHLDPFQVSAPERIALALDCVIGRVRQTVGAFAA
jgi:HPr kinase/phosphorylase